MVRFYHFFTLLIVFITAQYTQANESLSPVSTSLNPLQLEIVMMPIGKGQRAAYEQMISGFKVSAPDINVSIRVHEHEQFKRSSVSDKETSSAFGDVFFWFGGIRLQELANKSLIADLSSLWTQRGWSETFTEVAESAVTVESRISAIPLNYYQWGIYYRRSIFEMYNLSELEHWSDLISACEVLSKQGISLFTIGSKSPWSVAGWFDYLNLRINGLDYHNKLMRGEVSYNSTSLYKVFKYWKEAIDSGCFINSRNDITWKEALPLMYHGKASAVLMGNFFVADVPLSIKKDLAFSSFPIIDNNIQRYENAPVDVLVISKKSEGNAAVNQFIAYVVESGSLVEMNKAAMKLTPFKERYSLDDKFLIEGDKLLRSAKGITQFYDRNTTSEMATPAMDLMAKFLNQELTIDEVLYSLEQYRRHVFKKES